MKKRKQPGENISLKTKKNESEAVMEWINGQSNLMDSIRYLIENEIRQNGLRNLQHYIPSDRPMLPAMLAESRTETAAAAETAPAKLQEAAAVEKSDERQARSQADHSHEGDEIDEEDIESWL